MSRSMGPGSRKLKRWSFHVGALASLIGAVVILAIVISSYVEYDILRLRGVVLSLILMGVAAIVRSEAHSYVPVTKRESR
jgi:ABC-type branched-subunit amino acid transport system permease subunit